MRRSWGLRVLVLAVLGAALAVAAASAASGHQARSAALPLRSYKCSGAAVKLFDNWNVGGVLGGGTAASFSTKGKSYCVVSIDTYHWNKGHGKAPGTIGLHTIAGLGGSGNTFGPWLAKGSAGVGGVANADWTAAVPAGQLAVINGSYSCKDSDPASWAQNSTSGGRGFCKVYAKAATAFTPPPPAAPTYSCIGAQVPFYDGFNGGAVLSGGTPPTFTTAGKSYCLEVLTTYHWNNGQGQAPGTIALKVVAGLGGAGKTLGPWPATGSTGQGGAQNVGWGATPPASKTPLIINGTYTCLDSDPATWSQDAASQGHGFCRAYGQSAVLSVGGVPVPASSPAPSAGSSPTPTCATTPPSSYLVSPGRVAPGATTSFLLWCKTPASLDFQGSFAPLAVLIYDQASFNNLRFVNGYLQMISSSFPVRPPIAPFYQVVGPNDIDVVVPASLSAGTYIPVIVYAHGEVPSMNGLNVP